MTPGAPMRFLPDQLTAAPPPAKWDHFVEFDAKAWPRRVTHEMRLATELSHWLWVMDEGHVVERGRPSEVLEHAKSEVAREFLARERREGNTGVLLPTEK